MRHLLAWTAALWGALAAWGETVQRRTALDTPWKVLPIYGGGFMQNVVIAPSDPNVWYTYVDVGGPYRSDDAGKSWYPLHANLTIGQRDLNAGMVRTLDVDPRDANAFVMAAGDGPWRKGGVFVSRDGGISFRQTLSARYHANGPRRMMGLVLARNPAYPDELVAGSESDGLFLSRDNGETWKNVGLTNHWFSDVRYDATVTNRVWACAPWSLKHDYDAQESYRIRLGGRRTRERGFYRSDDGGETWTRVSAESPYEVRQIRGADRLVGVYGVFAQVDAAPGAKPLLAAASDDGGATWRKVSDAAPDEIAQVVGSSALVGIFNRRHVRQSADGGVTWTDFGEGLPPPAPDGLGYPRKGVRLALGAGRGFWVLGDSTGVFYRRGLSDAAWTALPLPHCALGAPQKETFLARHCGKDVNMPALGSVTVDPADDRHWFATDWFDLWESTDAGTNWTSRVDGLMQVCSFTVEVDPFDRETIAYGLADLGSFVSNDGGRSFRSQLPCYWASVAFSSVTPGLVMGCGGKATREINVSTDHGRTWRRASAQGLPAWSWGKVAPHGVNTVAVRPDRDAFWICVGGPVAPGKGGPYVSTDRGETWTWAGEGLPTDEREFVYGRTEWQRRTLAELVFSSDGSAVTASSFGKGDYWRLAPGARVWTKTNGRRDGFARHSLVADPFTPGRYVSGGRRPIESRDGGATWHPLAGLSERADFVCFDRFTPGLVVAACERDLKVSTDGGQSFRTFERGYPLPTGKSRQIQVFDRKIYFLTGGSGVFVKEIREK